ncbi:MAG: hypothetical protein IPK16_02195 [Anaerolineales bacterium]|nr:hypothetical protein [Anaerolineales bacterium]
MTDIADTITAPGDAIAPDEDVVVFGGEHRNMAMGVAMLGAGVAAFIATYTSTFFAQAIAWTFIIWGLFFLWGDLLLTTRRFEVRPDTFTVDIPFRLWGRRKVWAWKDVNRLDILIERRDSRPDDAQIRIHHVYPGSIRLDREDRSFEPELVRLIIDRAKLKPEATSGGVDLYSLPLNQEISFTWKK